MTLESPSFVVLTKQTNRNYNRRVSLPVEQAVLKEVTESEGQIVMFIDEIHTVVGAGATSGSMDASNLLKPMLARGELRCIGATTLNEYKQVWLSVTERDCDAREKRRFCSVSDLTQRQKSGLPKVGGLRGLLGCCCCFYGCSMYCRIWPS